MSQLTEMFATQYTLEQPNIMSIEEYLNQCKDDPMAYATVSERMLNAIGEPDLLDTSTDPRLSRLFSNRTIKSYPAFTDFYAMEEAIEKIVSFYTHAAQGLEERKQILYLLGPVGGGKSSLAEKLKDLMEINPIYVLADEDGVMSPYFESPLGLFDKQKKNIVSEDYNIPMRYLTGICGPWAQKRLKEFNGDFTKFRVAKIFPSKLRQIAISKTEPGDENNQDISSLVGKVDIRQLEKFSQHDADAYAYSGGLCLANQGLMEFVEMFKAPIKVLHPLLTATQEGNYTGTESIPPIPFTGTVLAHSNEAEWLTFKKNKNNEAFLDRIYIVKVPYCLRVTDEVKIYEKLIRESALGNAHCAPFTLKMLSQFIVLSRLKVYEGSGGNEHSKLRIYDGENLKDIDPKASSYEEYRHQAGIDEGMTGLSTRFGFKIISRVFNFDVEEVAANPVHLLYIIEKSIIENQFASDEEERYQSFLKNVLQAEYKKSVGKEIQSAYLDSYGEFGQNLYDQYISYADSWMQDTEFKDPDTGMQYSKSDLNEELEKLEKPAGIANPKDFRHEIVNYTLRYRASHEGASPKWTEYTKIKEVIEARMFSNIEDLLPVISFTGKGSQDEEKKHKEFVQRMVDRGYTEKQVRLVVEWYLRMKKSS